MKNILFIQGGGDDGYKADAKIVQGFKKTLGEDYKLVYPKLTTNETAPDFGWITQIEHEINKAEDSVIIIAHSLGASLLLKYLSENDISKSINGVFLLATPFWSGDEDWKQGLKLKEDFPDKLPKDILLFFYQSLDDKVVPFEQFKSYKRILPEANFHEFERAGHMFTGHLDTIAADIKALSKIK